MQEEKSVELTGRFKIQLGHFVGERKRGVAREFEVDFELEDLTIGEATNICKGLTGCDKVDTKFISFGLSIEENPTTFILGNMETNKGYRIIHTEYLAEPVVIVKGTIESNIVPDSVHRY